MKPTQCPETKNWYVVGYRTGRKYWGYSARVAEDLARMYFYA
jgi:hypothetical protein